MRVVGTKRGKDFKNNTLKICKKYNLKPNISKSKKANIEAVEIEKRTHYKYWLKELSKINRRKQKQFIGDWLECIDNETHSDSIKKIFKSGEFDQRILIKEIVKILYKEMINYQNFNKLVLLGDGTNSKIIKNNINDFNQKIDSGIIKCDKNYFRINQNYNIGWYIS